VIILFLKVGYANFYLFVCFGFPQGHLSAFVWILCRILLVDKLHILRLWTVCFTRVYFLKVHRAKRAWIWKNTHLSLTLW